ncbi:MAG: glycerol acyltransferase [Bacteroidetes bacterium]|nr:MAG: glycerol acyltransferase [Bacteroidota bacterium]
MHIDPAFDDIRPYTDEEVPVVIQRLIEKPSFTKLLKYVFPERQIETIFEELRQVNSVHQLQKLFIRKLVRSLIRQSISALTYEGFDNLQSDTAYLFVSNHRDIILDPALLNVLLFEHGFETSHIAIGNNLLFSRLVSDLMKLNKSFVVQRDLGRHEMYRHRQHLSAYIRYVITQLKEHVWIAQGNGRSKDGNDRTQTALLKLFYISGQDDFVNNLLPLHITPMSISYEYDPCDVEKARESYIRACTGTYTKAPDEDKKSMIRGITEPKGRVHLSLGRPLAEELEQLADITNKNERFRKLALMIDQQIHKGYRLWPNNYIAADWLQASDANKAFYTQEEKAAFEDYLFSRIAQTNISRDELLPYLLQIYANPLFNRQSYC